MSKSKNLNCNSFSVECFYRKPCALCRTPLPYRLDLPLAGLDAGRAAGRLERLWRER